MTIRIGNAAALALVFLLSGCAGPGQQARTKAWQEPLTEMEFLPVKGGCYEMGDTFGDGYDVEKPVHEVCVADFWMGKYEVTQGQWQKVMEANPSHFKNEDRHPVENVNWDDVQKFIEKLNQATGKRFRLPTEAEWEYAARSGGKREKWAGTNDEASLGEYAWFLVNSGEKTQPVGRKRPNGLGLHDMSGNVWEWVQDWYSGTYYSESPKDNPPGPLRLQTYRGLRGGSFNDKTRNIRTSNRSGAVGPPSRNHFTGFRLALSNP